MLAAIAAPSFLLLQRRTYGRQHRGYGAGQSNRIAQRRCDERTADGQTTRITAILPCAPALCPRDLLRTAGPPGRAPGGAGPATYTFERAEASAVRRICPRCLLRLGDAPPRPGHPSARCSEPIGCPALLPWRRLLLLKCVRPVPAVCGPGHASHYSPAHDARRRTPNDGSQNRDVSARRCPTTHPCSGPFGAVDRRLHHRGAVRAEA